jgi:NADH-ubiquinone oxidoreductase chain 4
MLNISLVIIPLIGTFIISTNLFGAKYDVRILGLIASLINFFLSLIIFILFDYSNIEYQFVQETYELSGISLYLGIDGISIYFILLTTLITPIVILSN